MAARTNKRVTNQIYRLFNVIEIETNWLGNGYSFFYNSCREGYSFAPHPIYLNHLLVPGQIKVFPLFSVYFKYSKSTSCFWTLQEKIGVS